MPTYKCISAYCEGSGYFEMSEEAQAKLVAKYGNEKKSCDACISWRKSQTDERIDCIICGMTFLVTARQAIGYQKFVDKWIKPTMCDRCKDNEVRREHIRIVNESGTMVMKYFTKDAPHPSAHLLKPLKKRWYQKIPLFDKKQKRKMEDLKQTILTLYQARTTLMLAVADWKTTPILDVETDPEVYKTLPGGRAVNGYQHIIDHYKSKKGDLDALNAKDENELFGRFADIASSESDEIFDFVDSISGYTIKYDESTGVMIAIDYLEKDSKHIVKTAYSPTEVQIVKKVTNQYTGRTSNWIPHFD